MVTEIRIYVEGGGQDNSSKRFIREGFNGFLGSVRDLARKQEVRWEIIPCGSRTVTFERFKTGLKTHPRAFNILLVDSESKVIHLPWEHLKRQDRWQVPDLPEEHCHFMVCTVEAWLAADPEALAAYYGQGFRRNALPAKADVETVEKETLMSALNRATERTQKGRYRKIEHCSELLKRLDPDRVRARARHCDLLFKSLEARIAG
jgi:Domain of unknown function (DUF4276)